MSREECDRCGACCVANSLDDKYYVQLDDGDLDSLTKADLRFAGTPSHERGPWMFVPNWDGALYLRTRRRKDMTVCAFLRGRVLGKSPCSCALQDRKPKACRVFRPGRPECWDARREVRGALEQLQLQETRGGEA